MCVRQCPTIIALESVKISTSTSSRMSGVKRNEKMKSVATIMSGMQIQLFRPSR